jgi:hypothetical protein
MVQMDLSFDENRKSYDPFFVRRRIWNSSSNCFTSIFLSMICECLKIDVTINFACKNVG